MRGVRAMAPAAHRELTAKDVMHRRVVTVDPEMTLREAAQVFLDRCVTGAPVVDADGKLVGVVSQTDLIRYGQRAQPAPSETPGYYHESDGEVLVSHMRAEPPATVQVQEIMTPAAFLTEADTPIREVARFMLRRHVHRIIVTRHGRLAGIISSMDLLRALVRMI